MEEGVDPGWAEAYASQSGRMNDGWRSILGPRPLFPREVMVSIPGLDADGHRDRRYNEAPYNMQEYLRLVRRNAPRRDMWVGWSQSNMYEEQQMEWLYGDVDSSDLQESLDKARRYEEHCIDLFGVQPLSIFSCGKGFHMHFTHDPVPYKGRAYAEAVQKLMEPAQADQDIAPIKHRTAKPRIPYTIHLGASGREQHPMYVVPVDLTWDLDEMLEAAKTCQTLPFEVPHSSEAAKLIRKPAAKIERKLAQMRSKPRDNQADSRLVQAALVFCQRNGPNMVDKHGRPDGRKRLLYSLLLPALMHKHAGNELEVMSEAQEFIEACNGRWSNYSGYVRECIKNVVMDDGRMRLPMGLPRFLSENQGLRFPA